jgi:DNA-directed RNA polymerase subunit RPC12/RpoP
MTPEQAAAPTSFICGRCGRRIKTSAGWVGRPETCPYCGSRSVVGSDVAPRVSDPRRTAANTLIVGLLSLGLGFIGLFFRKYFTEAASISAIALGLGACLLAMRTKAQLRRRRAEFPVNSGDGQTAIFRAGAGVFLGLVGMAIGTLSMVLAIMSMVR